MEITRWRSNQRKNQTHYELLARKYDTLREDISRSQEHPYYEKKEDGISVIPNLDRTYKEEMPKFRVL